LDAAQLVPEVRIRSLDRHDHQQAGRQYWLQRPTVTGVGPANGAGQQNWRAAVVAKA
jgi:hypothetical protein